jgi:hypothetical protein
VLLNIREDDKATSKRWMSIADDEKWIKKAERFD